MPHMRIALFIPNIQLNTYFAVRAKNDILKAARHILNVLKFESSCT